MDIISTWILLLVHAPLVFCQEGDVSDDVSKAFITLGVLTGALVVSLIVAKFVDYCYDRSTLRDDDSDISEHTRKLIRARVAVMKFSTKELKKHRPTTNQQRVSRVIRIWSAKSKRRRSEIQTNSDVVINVEEVPSKDEKQHLKFAFIQVPSVTNSLKLKTEDQTDSSIPLRLQVPLESELLLLEPVDDDLVEGTHTDKETPKPDVSKDTQKKKDATNISKPGVLNEISEQNSTQDVPDQVIAKNMPKQDSGSKINSPVTTAQVADDHPKRRAVSAKTADNVTNTVVRKNQSAGATKTIPRNPTKSSAPLPTPKFFPFSPKPTPFTKSKSVPVMNNGRVAPQTESPRKGPVSATQNVCRSESPPKILIKRPTEVDLVSKIKINPSPNLETVNENKDTRSASVITHQPLSVQSPRTVSFQPGQMQSKRNNTASPGKSNSQKLINSHSGSSKNCRLPDIDKPGKRAVHFTGEPRKSTSNNSLTSSADYEFLSKSKPSN